MWLLVVFDHFTKFAQAFPVRNNSAVTLLKKVMKSTYIGLAVLRPYILIREPMWMELSSRDSVIELMQRKLERLERLHIILKGIDKSTG